MYTETIFDKYTCPYCHDSHEVVAYIDECDGYKYITEFECQNCYNHFDREMYVRSISMRHPGACENNDSRRRRRQKANNRVLYASGDIYEARKAWHTSSVDVFELCKKAYDNHPTNWECILYYSACIANKNNDIDNVFFFGDFIRMIPVIFLDIRSSLPDEEQRMAAFVVTKVLEDYILSKFASAYYNVVLKYIEGEYSDDLTVCLMSMNLTLLSNTYLAEISKIKNTYLSIKEFVHSMFFYNSRWHQYTSVLFGYIFDKDTLKRCYITNPPHYLNKYY